MAILAVLSAAGFALSAGLDPAAELFVTRSLRVSVLRPFIVTHEVLESRTGLAARVAELEARRDSLALRVLAAQGLADENRQLRTLLGLPGRGGGDFFVAELVPGHTPGGRPGRFQLRTRSGPPFNPPLAVATTDGLLGVVRTAQGRIGMGEYWTHPDFRVAVLTADGAVTGIVGPFVTEAGEQMMLLRGVPFQTEVAPGTRLVTSGVGGIYPRGLAVGRVLGEHEEQLGWTHSFLVEPAVRPGREKLVVGWRPGALADSLYALPPDTVPEDTIRTTGTTRSTGHTRTTRPSR